MGMFTVFAAQKKQEGKLLHSKLIDPAAPTMPSTPPITQAKPGVQHHHQAARRTSS
jgi:hypothetical protein